VIKKDIKNKGDELGGKKERKELGDQGKNYKAKLCKRGKRKENRKLSKIGKSD